MSNFLFIWLVLVVVYVFGLVTGYLVGHGRGYARGYTKGYGDGGYDSDMHHQATEFTDWAKGAQHHQPPVLDYPDDDVV